MADHVAHLEPLPPQSYLMRVGPPGWSFGQPYEICSTVIDRGSGECEIRGLDRPVLPSHWRAIRECLREAGFRTVKYERRKAAGKELRVITI